MGIFDQMSSLGGDINNLVSKAESIKNTVYPVELQNLETADQNIAQKIATLQSSLPQSQNQVNNTNDIVQLRTYLMSHFGHIIQGGEPAPDIAKKVQIMAMPQYQKVKENFAQLNAGLAALESQYLHCSYGYKQADVQILAPDTNWSEQQHQQIHDQSVDQTPRCWLASDPTQFIS